jgi:tetratricopeptide (TPR) repeat protein
MTIRRTVFAVGLLLVAAAALAAGLASAVSAEQDKADVQIEAYLKKPAPLSKSDQDELARLLFRRMAYAEDDAKPEFYIQNYKLVMDKCPDSDRAHESYWRLTNLYNQAYDEPKHEEVVKILEQFLARYKTSTVVSMKKYPGEALVFSPLGSLHLAYEKLGRYDKIVAYYDKIAAQEAVFAVYDYFDYASALDEVKRLADAAVWYEKFLKKSAGDGSVDFMREVAEDRLKELRKK